MKRPVVLLLLLGALLPLRPALADVCGDAVRDAGEQCDDGNTLDLDGCSSGCRFEQVLRFSELRLEPASGPVCTANALGSALSPSVTQNQVQASLDAAIADGSLSITLPLYDLDDPAGGDDAVIAVGIVEATPSAGDAVPYDGNSDLDWWYLPRPGEIDFLRQPDDFIFGAIEAGSLSVGPGAATLTLPLIGTPVAANLSSVRMAAVIGAGSTPAVSVGGPPGHRPDEQLDPALQSFASIGDGRTGTLCGNLRARSLANTPLPAGLEGVCTAYSSSNSLLDLLVGGCTFVIPVVLATQPDQEDAGSAPAGAGPPYTFTVDATTRQVTGCMASGSPAPLDQCLDDAAFSSFFTFGARRVILIGDAIFRSGFES